MSGNQYRPVPVSTRLLALCTPEPNTGCWLWMGSANRRGYGVISVGAKLRLAHRVSWEIANGAKAGNLSVCHRCDNTFCVNPSHLWLGTHADNMADMARKGRAARQCGENHPRAKLTEAAVAEIRASRLSNRALARAFGVGRSVIRRARSGETWKRKGPAAVEFSIEVAK